jgi:hypothetical protein
LLVKTVLLVDLLQAYLNRGDLLHDLREAAQQVKQADEAPAETNRSVRTAASGFRQRRLTDRLTDEQVQKIVSAFEAGTPRWRLAEEFGISLSSVGRLLRQHRLTQLPK